MVSRDAWSELCCFAATCLGVAAFLLVLSAFELALHPAMAEARLLLIFGAGIAFVLMTVFTSIAVRMERNHPA